MGRLLSVFAAVGILSAATVALAAEATYRTTGKIKSVDLMQHVITLENGSTYKVARGVNIKGTKAGQKVTVSSGTHCRARLSGKRPFTSVRSRWLPGDQKDRKSVAA